MDYYEKRRRAALMIIELNGQGVDDKKIALRILTVYGFGTKFVERTLETLDDAR